MSEEDNRLSSEQEAEIVHQRSQKFETRRNVAPGLEEILFEMIPVLDHGFIRVVDYMGDDASVVQAARVSYGRGTRKVNEDKSLINYLLSHNHTTPFEMAEIKLHVKLPIFVARQWIRHRTANVNEYSARYSILDKEFYVPSPEQLAAQSQVNRQGRGATLEADQAQEVLNLIRRDAEHAYDSYMCLLNEGADGAPVDSGRSGLARELARMNLTLNYYTQWYWKVDLHNLMHFLRLRADPHAQYEIRVYALELLEILKRWVPLTYDAFVEHRLEAFQLSATALKVVRQMLEGEEVTQASSGLSSREWGELMSALGMSGTK